MDNSHSMAFTSLFSSKVAKELINSHDVAEIPFSELELESKTFAEGGGGKLYRGLYKQKIKIAAKTVLEDMVLTDLEEFRQEYKVLTKLRHPGIIRTYGTALDPKTDKLYLIAEMCEGGSIIKYIDKTNLGSTPATFAITFTKIFEAIDYMHNKAGLVHRDLKPLNLLLADGSDVSSIKLCDMGLARHKSSSIDINVGTAIYMPPEAFDEDADHLGEGYDGFSWDIYSLSGIMVELWNRGHPWVKFAHHKIIARVSAGKRPEFPKTTTAPPALRALVTAMWAHKHEDRPNISQVIAAFKPIAKILIELGSSHESWQNVNWDEVQVEDEEELVVKSAEVENLAEEARIRSLRISQSTADDDDDENAGEVMNVRRQVELVDGWHVDSGSFEEREEALNTLWQGKPIPIADEMTEWYYNGPWNATFPPHRWYVEDCKITESSKHTSGLSSILNSGITVISEEDYFTSKVKFPVGFKITKWLVCAYLTSYCRLIKCVEGFASPEEQAFPYSLQTFIDINQPSDENKNEQSDDSDNDEGAIEVDDESSINFDNIFSDPGSGGGGGEMKPSHSRRIHSSFSSLMTSVSSPRSFRSNPVKSLKSSQKNNSTNKPTVDSLGLGRKGSNLSSVLSSRASLNELDSMDTFVFEEFSPLRGKLTFLLRDKPFKCLRELGPNFWNVRTSYTIMGGLVDLGNHISIIRLKNGKFLFLGAVDPNGWADGHPRKGQLRKELDRLTRHGSLIEAVVATHPFHTMGFEPFIAAYGINSDANPEGIKYYGTPRHLRRLPEVNWSGDVTDPEVQVLWSEHGIELRVPEGVEFHDPQPAPLNHFASVFVYHSPSRILHNDDCLCYYNNPSRKMGIITRAAPSVRHGQLRFHQSFDSCGMTMPNAFRDWFQTCLDDWPFETLCTAHNGVLGGNANNRARELLSEMEPVFIKIQQLRDEDPYVKPPFDPLSSARDTNCECG